MLAIGDDGSQLLEVDVTGLITLDRADAGADIPADTELGGRRSEQQLALGHLGQVVPEEL